MTKIAFEDALEYLREHGIRVVRARAVDSAEDAISFAARRPIDLCLVVPFDDSNLDGVESGLQATDSIRHAYRRLEERRQEALPSAHVLARRAVEHGTDVIVDARDDAVFGRVVEIRGGNHVVHRLHPLGQEQAKALLADFHSKHGIASSEARTHMLVRLLLRVSEIFENAAIERITLDPVRVHGNSYDVLGVRLTANRQLDLNPRLAHHAHDRKGYYTPSGQQ